MPEFGFQIRLLESYPGVGPKLLIILGASRPYQSLNYAEFMILIPDHTLAS